MVEFTLVFLLLLAICWIPADFGLAFFTGQLASNAAREGARIGAADPGAAAQMGNCSIPACYSLTDGTVLRETAERVSRALMPDTSVTAAMLGTAAACDQSVQVTVTGHYGYSFFRLLRFFKVNVDPNVTITRVAKMRWEHQC